VTTCRGGSRVENELASGRPRFGFAASVLCGWYRVAGFGGGRRDLDGVYVMAAFGAGVSQPPAGQTEAAAHRSAAITSPPKRAGPRFSPSPAPPSASANYLARFWNRQWATKLNRSQERKRA
jgi:hypothetical protein